MGPKFCITVTVGSDTLNELTHAIQEYRTDHHQQCGDEPILGSCGVTHALQYALSQQILVVGEDGFENCEMYSWEVFECVGGNYPSPDEL